MTGLDIIINELRGMREDLQECNAALDESEKVRRAMEMNERTYRNAPRVIRSYKTGKVSLFRSTH